MSTLKSQARLSLCHDSGAYTLSLFQFLLNEVTRVSLLHWMRCKSLKVFLPEINLPVPMLYTWVERGTVRVTACVYEFWQDVRQPNFIQVSCKGLTCHLRVAWPFVQLLHVIKIRLTHINFVPMQVLARALQLVKIYVLSTSTVNLLVTQQIPPHYN